MPELIKVLQMCGDCGSTVGTFEVKKENLMLSTRNTVWCPKCNDNKPEVRDLEGRLESIKREVDSLPKPTTP